MFFLHTKKKVKKTCRIFSILCTIYGTQVENFFLYPSYNKAVYEGDRLLYCNGIFTMDCPMIYELCHRDERGIEVIDAFESMAEAEEMMRIYQKKYGPVFFIR